MLDGPYTMLEFFIDLIVLFSIGALIMVYAWLILVAVEVLVGWYLDK